MIDAKNFPGRGKVALLRTRPETVLEDYYRLMHLCDYAANLPKEQDTLLKINISWQIWYPGCSTTPWQLDGVIRTLLRDGYQHARLIAAHNNTVVVDAKEGALNNRHKLVTDHYGIRDLHTYESGVEWVTYQPKQPFSVLDKIYPDGVRIPKAFYDKNVLHLPTIKCVHPSTEIVLANGSLVRIGDLIEGTLDSAAGVEVDQDGDTRLPLYIALQSLAPSGEIRPQSTLYAWRTPLKGRKVWIVRTKTGREVRVSSEHPFLTPQGWKSAQALQVGERVAIPRKITIIGKSQPLPRLRSPNRGSIDVDLPSFKEGRAFTGTHQREIVRAYLAGEQVKQTAQTYSVSTSSVKRIVRQAGIEPREQRNWSVTAPTHTSPEFWRWVGYFAAEGYIDENNYFRMVNSEPTIQADYCELTRSLFNTRVEFERGKEARFRSDQLAEFFAQLGWTAPLKAENKKVPPLLFECSDQEICAFLAGYLDGDATFGPGSNPEKRSYASSVTSKSERLIKDVQYLLTRLGVVSFKSNIWNKVAGSDMEKQLYHTLSIYGADLALLAQHIRLRSLEKQRNLDAALKIKHDTNWDTVPLPSQLLKEVRTGLGLSQRDLAQPYSESMVSMIESGKRTASRNLARHLVTTIEHCDPDGKFTSAVAQLRDLVWEAIAWDFVESAETVEPDSEYLYDLTMEGDPNFVGNGLILHNTHVFTTLTGAMKNSFGGLLDEKRHWTHANIHDTLVDLLQIQQDIHTGIFCVMDGTFAGEGPGPRAMRPYVKNTIMASADPVAIDAMSAKVMGIDPMGVRFIRHAHERGLGVGNPRDIQIVGDTAIAEENWHFAHDEDTFASWGQKQIYHGALKPFEHLLLRTPLVPWSYAASNVYHNLYWYPFIGHKRAEMMLNTAWGQKFLSYSEGLPFNPGAASKMRFAALSALALGLAAALGLGTYYATRRREQF